MTTTSQPISTAHAGSGGPGDRPLRWFAGVPFRLQTYRNLLYLALAFPLGVLYFVTLVTGVSLGVGLLVVLVGAPLLLVTVVGATILAGFEARLSSWLVGVDAPLPEVLRPDHRRGLAQSDVTLLDALVSLVTAPTTWTSLVLLLVKFVYGVVAFTALVTAFAIVTAMLAAPLVYSDPTVQYQLGQFTIETLPAAVAVAGAGVLAGVLSLHLLNGLAIAGGLLTAGLLAIVPDSPSTDDAVGDESETTSASDDLDLGRSPDDPGDENAPDDSGATAADDDSQHPTEETSGPATDDDTRFP